MTTDPNTQPLSEAADSLVTNTGPQGPVSAAPLPLPGESVSSEAATDSSPKRPTRADWVRIAIFGIPYAAFFLVGVPTWIFPASWSLTAINIGLDTILLIMALAFFWREFFPAFTYLRTRPVRKIALLFGLWFLVTAIQAVTRIALYGHNQPIAENQQQVMNLLNDGALGIVFTFFVGIGVPVIEEMFFRHILIGKLSAYAPTWLVASISAALFAYMHSHQWQDFFMYLPLSIVLTLVYVKSGKNVAYSWTFHALNNSIMLIVRSLV
ncbi:CPBP family intramembrane metalloprotease [Schaalia odontolytica]|uniref:CAAX protease n=1 Tax=Schaalia odontolytica TaxID=1660 RepID=A0A0V8RZX9_9ACTO|nr:type II CAAX endopeptidase family protein [Schaalia odontolytica]KSW13514.1 CAAX protease [Schaalia odontolytica]QCT34802.1 CPBP family intramembrane metalloprotease [Schaalia odontolytica]